MGVQDRSMAAAARQEEYCPCLHRWFAGISSMYENSMPVGIGSLPDSVLVQAFSHLHTAHDRLAALCTCKAWYRAAREHGVFWKEARFPEATLEALASDIKAAAGFAWQCMLFERADVRVARYDDSLAALLHGLRALQSLYLEFATGAGVDRLWAVSCWAGPGWLLVWLACWVARVVFA